MTHITAKAAQAIQTALNEHGLKCTAVEMPGSTRTAQKATEGIGCKVAQIAKSLIFKTLGNKPVFVLASGPNRVSEKAIEA